VKQHTNTGDPLTVSWAIPGEGHLSQYVTSHPDQLSLAIPSWVGEMSTSQKGGDTLWLESKGRYGACVGGR